MIIEITLMCVFVISVVFLKCCFLMYRMNVFDPIALQL